MHMAVRHQYLDQMVLVVIIILNECELQNIYNCNDITVNMSVMHADIGIRIFDV